MRTTFDRWTISARLGAILCSMFAAPVMAAYGSKYNLQPPASALARDIYDLHLIMMWICVAIFVGVFGVMFYSIYKHRKSVGHKAAQFHENTTVEILWTIVPFLILVAMAWPATKTVIAHEGHLDADITIKVTGYQWKWGYDYLKGEGEGISSFATWRRRASRSTGRAPKGEHYLLEVDNHVVVPVGKKVRVLTTADDVIHSWWVPAFGVKQDAIPGLRPRHLVPGREGRHLSAASAPSCAARTTASCRSWSRWSRRTNTPSWVGEQKKKLAAARRGPEQGYGPRRAEGARREGLRRQLRRPATRPTARACRRRSRRSTAPRSCTGPKDDADRHRAERQAKDAPPWRRSASSCRTSISPRSSPTSATPGATRPARSVQPAEVKAAAQVSRSRRHGIQDQETA